MGVGIGGGLAPCVCTIAQDDMIYGSTIYARLTLPFIYKFAKFGIGFDYIFMPEPRIHTTVSTAFRLNLFANLRLMELFR
jgi:hypothetical protein